MRLIDADLLKETFIVNTDKKGYLVADPEVLIDNAPTVTPDKIQAIMSDYLVYRCEPQRLQGEWLKNAHEIYKCSYCGGFGNSNYFNFCPNCGADMRGRYERR